MEYDTINYYLLFNKDNEVLVFYDQNSNDVVYPQKEEKNCDETIESKIATMMMALKEKSSDNDTLIMKKEIDLISCKHSFMSRFRELVDVSDAELVDSYNGEYKLYEYSEGRFLLEVDYLVCNYYAKYIDFTPDYYARIKTLGNTYGYDVDFIKIDDILAFKEGQFESSKRYIKKLQKTIDCEID